MTLSSTLLLFFFHCFILWLQMNYLHLQSPKQLICANYFRNVAWACVSFVLVSHIIYTSNCSGIFSSFPSDTLLWNRKCVFLPLSRGVKKVWPKWCNCPNKGRCRGRRGLFISMMSCHCSSFLVIRKEGNFHHIHKCGLTCLINVLRLISGRVRKTQAWSR